MSKTTRGTDVKTEPLGNNSSLQIEYMPVSNEVIEEYVHIICSKFFPPSNGNPSCSHEVHHGLAIFLKSMSRAMANNLNRQQKGRGADAAHTK